MEALKLPLNYIPMKYLPFLTLLTCLLIVSSHSFGQVKALVNEVATNVDYSDGQLKALYEKYPNFMDGYEKAPFDPFKKVPPRFNVQNFAEIENQSLDLANNSRTLPVKEVQTTVSTSTSSKNVNEKDKFIYFVGAGTVIDKNSLSKVEVFSGKMKRGESKSILIKGWYRTDDSKSQNLIMNRLEACKAKLEENGVPSNLILTSILGSNKEARHVSVLLQ